MTILKVVAAVVIGLVLLAGAGFAALVAYGREAAWDRIGGPAPLVAYDFDAPVRTGSPNDVLACPDGACASGAPELASPRFAAGADAVFEAARRVLADEMGAEIIAEDRTARTLQAIVRSRLMRFPDDVTLKVTTGDDGRSLVWMYSASRIGRNDFGVNRARAEEITRRLESALSKIAP
ncbi:DUF1499 domain-containing protein [Methylobrevis pamukkalensis]|uniref:DUF1499 domain-containing protein n=1 Tax=Methylobrevis pamukkalensis TaxID=1439726 RepID=A0A1E3GYG5_9HYPH|nr:DUF1499 domain-containing protein [Methylobrevis pamukkalensis]ODN68586.1 hypothetical protein A6302_04115 [Methylobrevis pamukkalensis]